MSAARLVGPLTAVALGLALTTVTANAQQAVAPNQRFAGSVNGSTTSATVDVVCTGPARMGHPRGGQPMQVVEGTGTGFTGDSATRIVATLTPSGSSQPLVFTRYGVPQDIPTTALLPCAGTGTATFTPQPTSSRAMSATVVLRFVSMGRSH